MIRMSGKPVSTPGLTEAYVKHKLQIVKSPLRSSRAVGRRFGIGRVEVRNNLRRLRREAELTQEELAARLGVTRQTVIAIENGRYLPSIVLALKIARFFGRPVEEIFWLSDGQPAEKVRGADQG